MKILVTGGLGLTGHIGWIMSHRPDTVITLAMFPTSADCIKD